MRAKFQVLIIPFALVNKKLEVALFKTKEGYWQFIAGGGENKETKIQAAKREAFEEARIENSHEFYELETFTMIPRIHFHAHKNKKHIYVIPEYSFAVMLNNKNMDIANEHLKYKWFKYEEAMKYLKYDSNRTALWELNEKIKDGKIG